MPNKQSTTSAGAGGTWDPNVFDARIALVTQ
jgi:hypothetical protein